MSSIDFTIPAPAWDLVQELLANLSQVENDEPRVTLAITAAPSVIHREPAEGYMWQGSNFHPTCLVETMIAMRELSPAARDMTPAEAVRQRNRANFAVPDTDVFHIEPVAGTLSCARCATPWVLA